MVPAGRFRGRSERQRFCALTVSYPPVPATLVRGVSIILSSPTTMHLLNHEYRCAVDRRACAIDADAELATDHHQSVERQPGTDRGLTRRRGRPRNKSASCGTPCVLATFHLQLARERWSPLPSC
jgi:hypothetical protein